MRRKNVPTSWFRRLTAPLRAFIRVDIDMTEQALRRAPGSAVTLLCAPSNFLLWILDQTEASIEEVRALMRPRRQAPRPSSPPDPAE